MEILNKMPRMKPLVATLSATVAAALLTPQMRAANVLLSDTASFTFRATYVAIDPDDLFDGSSGLGIVEYSLAGLTFSGTEYRQPEEEFGGLKLTFELFLQSFTEANDVDYPFLPELTLQNGIPVRLDFLVDEAGNPHATAINEPGVFNFNVSGWLTPAGEGAGLLNQIQPASPGPDYHVPLLINVPEPSGVAFAIISGLGLGGLILARRRCHRQRPQAVGAA